LQSDLEIAEPRDRIWGTWPTIGFSALVLIVSQAAQIFVAIVYLIKELVSNPDVDLFQYSQDLASNGMFLSFAVITSSIVGFGLTVIFIKRRKGSTVTEYLGLKPISKKQIFIMIGICILFLILSQLAALLIGISDDSDYFTDMYKSSWLPLLVVAVAIFAPAFEESFFRGFLFVGLRQSPIGDTGTIALTAALWAMFHIQYGIFGILLIFSLGIVLGFVRWKTESLWAPIIIHSLWNLSAVVMAVLYID